MPWFHEVLTLISRSQTRSRPGLGVRVLAGVLSAVLVFGSIAPGVAFAGEADSEQEGSAPPGALPGLEEGADFEPGGEEAVLEELPGAVSGGESEEGPPLESEPPQESEPPPLPPEVPAASTELSPAAGEESASVPPQGPDYTPAEEPTAEAAPSPPVENQSLIAPQSPPAGEPFRSTRTGSGPAARGAGSAQWRSREPCRTLCPHRRGRGVPVDDRRSPASRWRRNQRNRSRGAAPLEAQRCPDRHRRSQPALRRD
jgi:hypothetical protein